MAGRGMTSRLITVLTVPSKMDGVRKAYTSASPHASSAALNLQRCVHLVLRRSAVSGYTVRRCLERVHTAQDMEQREALRALGGLLTRITGPAPTRKAARRKDLLNWSDGREALSRSGGPERVSLVL